MRAASKPGRGHAATVEALLAAGARADLQAKGAGTALLWAQGESVKTVLRAAATQQLAACQGRGFASCAAEAAASPTAGVDVVVEHEGEKDNYGWLGTSVPAAKTLTAAAKTTRAKRIAQANAKAAAAKAEAQAAAKAEAREQAAQEEAACKERGFASCDTERQLSQPLLDAAASGDLAKVAAALKAGASTDFKSANGKSARDVAYAKTPWSGSNDYSKIVGAIDVFSSIHAAAAEKRKRSELRRRRLLKTDDHGHHAGTASTSSAGAASGASAKPHILLTVVDDHGHFDASHKGSRIRTPTIDKFALGGVQLAQMYAQSPFFRT